jgi:predicted DNA-binding transcriptional regulator AlpA
MAKLDSVEFFTCKEAARFLRLDIDVFYRMMRRKGGPPVIKLSQRCARIPKHEFMEWLESRKMNGEKRA